MQEPINKRGLPVFWLCADRGTTYEFRVSAKNDVDYGERAVATIKTPDGGQ